MQPVAPKVSFGQVALQFLLQLAERKHVVQALAVLGMKCAVVHLAHGVSVHHLRGNEVIPEPAAVRSPVSARLGLKIPAALLA